MNYLIYKITNTVNNKNYIGCHKTEDVNDGYMGSGKILKRAIKKYGLDSFTKEILHNCNNSEDMFSMESELVNEDFVADRNTYNLKEGGYGGFDHVNGSEFDYHNPGNWSDIAKLNHSLNGLKSAKRNIKNGTGFQGFSKKERQEIAKKTENVLREKYPNWTFGGKEHTAETKAKMSKSHKGKHTGSKNSQYGTMWITNDEVNKKIKKDQPIPEGFRKGRKIK